MKHNVKMSLAFGCDGDFGNLYTDCSYGQSEDSAYNQTILNRRSHIYETFSHVIENKKEVFDFVETGGTIKSVEAEGYWPENFELGVIIHLNLEVELLSNTPPLGILNLVQKSLVNNITNAFRFGVSNVTRVKYQPLDALEIKIEME